MNETSQWIQMNEKEINCYIELVRNEIIFAKREIADGNAKDNSLAPGALTNFIMAEKHLNLALQFMESMKNVINSAEERDAQAASDV